MLWDKFGEAEVDLFDLTTECAMSPVVFHERQGQSPPWWWTTVASDTAVCVSPCTPNSETISSDTGGRALCHRCGTRTIECLLVPYPNSVTSGGTVAKTMAQGRLGAIGRGNPPSSDHRAAPVGLAAEPERLESLGLPPAVVRTIQGARASSTTSAYAGRWAAFQRWCVEESGPHFMSSSSRSDILYLQSLVDDVLAPSTVKAYAAAISSCHEGFGGNPVFSQPLVKHFLRRARRQ